MSNTNDDETGTLPKAPPENPGEGDRYFDEGQQIVMIFKPCRYCDGSGLESNDGKKGDKKCLFCEGARFVAKHDFHKGVSYPGPNGSTYRYDVCPSCNGSGKSTNGFRGFCVLDGCDAGIQRTVHGPAFVPIARAPSSIEGVWQGGVESKYTKFEWKPVGDGSIDRYTFKADGTAARERGSGGFQGSEGDDYTGHYQIDADNAVVKIIWTHHEKDVDYGGHDHDSEDINEAVTLYFRADGHLVETTESSDWITSYRSVTDPEDSK